MGQENVYISYNYPCIIPFLVKISLVKLKYLYFQYSWISIMKNKIVTKWKGWKDVGTCQNVWPLSSQVSTFSTVLWNCKRIWNWNLDRNLIMTLLIMVICSAVWKTLYNIKIKEPRRQDIINFSFKMFKIMKSLRSSKCLKTTFEVTFTTQKANACSRWTACLVCCQLEILF